MLHKGHSLHHVGGLPGVEAHSHAAFWGRCTRVDESFGMHCVRPTALHTHL